MNFCSKSTFSRFYLQGNLSLKVFGTLGGLEVTNTGELGTLRMCSGKDLEAATWKDVALTPVPTNYQRFTDAVRSGAPMIPDFADATRLQAVIDAASEAHDDVRTI